MSIKSISERLTNILVRVHSVVPAPWTKHNLENKDIRPLSQGLQTLARHGMACVNFVLFHIEKWSQQDTMQATLQVRTCFTTSDRMAYLIKINSNQNES